MIYNIPLNADPLKRVADFLFSLAVSGVDLSRYRLFLPNKRSHNVLKRIISKNLSVLPQIEVISDEFDFDKQKITMLVTYLLNIKNVPKNVIYELASSLTELLIDIKIHDVKNIKQLVPEKLQEYWAHTVSILEYCLNDKNVSRELMITDKKFKLFINSISKNNENIISIGIGDTNRYTRMFLSAVASSDNGIIFMIGTENSKNYQYNQTLLTDLQLNNIDQTDFCIDDLQQNRVEFCECNDTNEEASIIALAIRKMIINKSILVVTADNILRQKIKSELQRWNIFIDDSLGTLFSRTKQGLLILDVLDVIQSNFETFQTINMLKHINNMQELEISLKKQNNVPKFFYDVVKEQPNFIEYKNFDISQQRTFKEWYEFTLGIASFAGDLSEFTNLVQISMQYSELLGKLTFSEYKALLVNTILNVPIHYSKEYTGNVVMVGMIEAQLLAADFVIIAGANESSMMASKKENFWFSKSMLNKLNISTSDSQNRFIQCIFERLVHKPEVLITRSKIVDGVQQQKYSFIDKLSSQIEIHESTKLIDLSKAIKNSYKEQKINDTFPNPPLDARPSRFSVTAIDLLKNNPYAFYAKNILKLREFNDDSWDIFRGNYIHSILEKFFKSKNKNMTELLRISQEMLISAGISQSDFGIWFFRIKKICEFVLQNIDRSAVAYPEIFGEYYIDSNPGFSVYCKADRIDILSDTSAAIIDYKTGQVPTEKQIEFGFKAQLPIEAIIVTNGGFSFGKKQISSICYWQLSGAKLEVKFKKSATQVVQLMQQTLDGLKNLIHVYNVIGIPYEPNPCDPYNKKYNHLARVKDWFDA